MTICGIKQTLPGVYQITSESGSAFFLRARYLKVVKENRFDSILKNSNSFLENEQDDLSNQNEFSEEEYADILSAALTFSAENAAMTYLARAEQCRFLLTQKLIHKQIDKNCINEALDYLEEVHYLDDSRFAEVWLRNRAIDHAEGRIKLTSELSSRGIDRRISKAALDDFFNSHNEIDLCKRAYEKLVRQKVKPEKIEQSLRNKGFTMNEIKTALK